MFKTATLLAIALLTACAPAPTTASAADVANATRAGAMSDLKLTALDGSRFDTSVLKGKAVLFVNVASKCGNTPQYEGLQALYEAHAASGLVIVGVPSNQFGGQEPGSPEEIATFCKMNYGVTFPLLEKQDVNGKGRSALYRWLVDSPAGGGTDVGWNFEKFLVDTRGEVVGRFPSRVKPSDPALVDAIRTALK